MNEKDMKIGWYGKYIIEKSDGSPIDPDAEYFVIRIDKDPAARIAARAYAGAIKYKNQQLYKDIITKCSVYENASSAINKTAVENIITESAMKKVREELKSDKSEGSWYYGWQSNIACVIMDNSDINHDKANEIAIKFLELLIRD
jgi:hypothetical protein